MKNSRRELFSQRISKLNASQTRHSRFTNKNLFVLRPYNTITCKAVEYSRERNIVDLTYFQITSNKTVRQKDQRKITPAILCSSLKTFGGNYQN